MFTAFKILKEWLAGGDIIKVIVIASIILTSLYTVIGVGTQVDEIKKAAPYDMAARGWEVLTHEGYQYGSWGHHGGKVWYRVRDISSGAYFRVFVCMWSGDLQYYYNEPEKLMRVNVDTVRDAL